MTTGQVVITENGGFWGERQTKKKRKRRKRASEKRGLYRENKHFRRKNISYVQKRIEGVGKSEKYI